LRIECGPRDMENNVIQMIRRDKEKLSIAVPTTELCWMVQGALDDIQRSLLTKARRVRDERTVRARNWTDFVGALNRKCMALAPHCNTTECEEIIKERSNEAADKADIATEESKDAEAAAEEGEKLTGSAKSLCMPFDEPLPPSGTPCVQCSKPATVWTLFGRSY
jgi:prolyl-tRNA synthetase